MDLAPLPPTYPATRAAAHAVACFVLAPARKAVDGRIGLRPTGDGFGTPPFGDRSRRLVVRRAQLVVEEGGAAVARERLSTVRAAAGVAGVELAADPGVGTDLPPFAPDEPLALDGDAADALATWFAFADMVLVDGREALAGRGHSSELTLWPEHFDLAFDWGPDDERRVNLGASPGDATSDEPYLYVGPWGGPPPGEDPYWNAPFGATLSYAELLTADDRRATALAFLREGVARLAL